MSAEEATHSPLLDRVREKLPGDVVSTHAQLGDATVVVDAARIVPVMRFLRDDEFTAFDMLMDLTAVDHLGREPRFEVVYHLYSLARGHRLRVKAGVSEAAAGTAGAGAGTAGAACEIDTILEIWPAANWMEREVWDLYGIRFRNHPDLRRLLLYEEFEGHPLRKDYPKERRQPLVGPQN